MYTCAQIYRRKKKRNERKTCLGVVLDEAGRRPFVLPAADHQNLLFVGGLNIVSLVCIDVCV